eukprot:16438934-Heterocapsa_arctica.AAC.1
MGTRGSAAAWEENVNARHPTDCTHSGMTLRAKEPSKPRSRHGQEEVRQTEERSTRSSTPGAGARKRSCGQCSQDWITPRRKGRNRKPQAKRSTPGGNRTVSSRTWQRGGSRPTLTSGTGRRKLAGAGRSTSSTTTRPRERTGRSPRSSVAPSRRRTPSGKGSEMPPKNAQRKKRHQQQGSSK